MTQRPFGILRTIRDLFASVPDNEHEMAGNRLGFGLAGSAFLLLYLHLGSVVMMVAAAYVGLSCLVLLDVLVRRSRSIPRRAIAIIADMTVISISLHLGDGSAGMFYPLYLWTIFGNGFRFGTRYLLFATSCAIVGFLFVVTSTAFWQRMPGIGFGLLGALAVLPAYAGVLIEKLSRATRTAEEASRVKSMFLASVSHEFRTPLNAIVGSVALLEDTVLDREQRELTAALGSGTRRLLDMVGSVLDFSRLEAGRMPVQPAAFALAPLLADITTMLRPQARIKGIRLGVHFGRDVPDMVVADRRHLHEILINLAGNAIKFTDSGSVTIHLERRPAPDGRTALLISVVDTGIGIKPAAQERIFESFAQADGSIIDRFGGTGLGLAICRHLVRLMGGEIDVESDPGEGSRFWFSLDLPRCETVGDAPAANRDPCRCVLMLDDPALRLQARSVADALGPVSIATTIDQAVHMLRTSREAAILLLQRHNPATVVKDGLALARLDPARELPCILIGAMPLPPDRHSAISFVDTLLQPAWPGGALERAIGRTRALHPADGVAPPTKEVMRIGPAQALHVLIADDNAINRQVLSKILERVGHRVCLVDNGDQALEALSRDAFDLVLMDVNMPVLNGIEATRLHRLSEFGATRLPILALTADPTETMRSRCLEAGMDQCLNKPIEPRRLLALIDTLFPASTVAAEPVAGVARLADHPRFRVALTPLDRQVTDELAQLGGESFVLELLADFDRDSDALIGQLSKAAAAGDMQAFRNHLHALRSISANVGAIALHETSGAGRTIESATLRRDGPELARRLGQELERFRRAVPSAIMIQRAP